MTMLGALAAIFVGALFLAGIRQHTSKRSDAGPLGLGLDPSSGNGSRGKHA